MPGQSIEKGRDRLDRHHCDFAEEMVLHRIHPCEGLCGPAEEASRKISHLI